MKKKRFIPKVFFRPSYSLFSISQNPFRYSLNRDKGFSLIEILLAIAIIGILVLIGIPRTRDWLNQYRLNGAAKLVWADLNRAKMTAIKENQSITVTFNPDTMTSYTFSRSGVIFFTRNLTQEYPGITVAKTTGNVLTFFSTGLTQPATINVQGIDNSKSITTLSTGRIQTT